MAIVFLALNQPGSVFAQNSRYSTVPDLEMDLSFAHFPESKWTLEQIRAHTSGVEKVFDQCQIRLGKVQIFPIQNPRLPQRLAARNENHPLSVEKFAAQLGWLPKPAVFLIEGLLEVDPPTPFARDQFREMNDRFIPEEVLGTIWFPSHVNTAEYAKEREKSPYSVLAHEIAHLLTLDGQHNNDRVPNLLTIWKRRTNHLTPEQCTEMRGSPYLHQARLP